MNTASIAVAGIVERNPAWIQMLGLCPLLAVSSSVVNALGLAAASALVLIGSNTIIALMRNVLPHFARLPAFMLLIAGLTTLAVMLMEAFAYELYLGIALFVQIIVTNCIILGATSPDQLSANLAALEEGPLSENALRTCDVIWSALKGPAPKYNR